MTTNAGYASIDGARLYFESTGDGAPLVLISGGGLLDLRGWDDQVDVFTARFRVVRYDVRGLGRSTRPTGEFSHSEDLYGLLEFLHIRTAIVGGVSFGAAIALDLALEHPERVSGLVLAGPGLSSDKDRNVEALRGLAERTQREGLEHVIGLLTTLPSFISPGNTPAKDRIRRIYLDNRDVFESGFPLATLWKPVERAADRLGNVEAPALIVVGDEDDAAVKATAERLAAGIAGARTVVISGAAHMVNLDRPDDFNRIVLAFLLALSGGSVTTA